MANHSDAFPEGSLTKEQLMSFFAISGESGNFKYSPGWERIPDNWYKRAIGDEYTIPGFLADVLDHAGKYPPFLNISGNTGSPNSFFTADLRSLTSGVFSGADLLDGNNLECFLLQVSQAPTPDSLGGAETQIGIKDQLLTPLRTTISERLGALACPKLDNIDKSQYNFFPGYNNCPDGCSGTMFTELNLRTYFTIHLALTLACKASSQTRFLYGRDLRWLIERLSNGGCEISATPLFNQV
ncbi:hypothetical protein IFR04_002670 [Cadophora malorum]|uniref:Heme haloperoxidase family profile domain-containing protein n=1 Tax=Cadophora malorum TaxID=108018 RepID=A0A8H8BUA7_9HELO|nr:hypothetical protein IFR04_002670 [Cadophora malorum]